MQNEGIQNDGIRNNRIQNDGVSKGRALCLTAFAASGVGT
jgi:hypothetical protein